ncbi:MAG: glycoside hydrolase family 18 [Verrucomicrobiales bacterium]|nr:glycoside hydrolase family 18 [Verrucomicrobiales bacterium]
MKWLPLLVAFLLLDSSSFGQSSVLVPSVPSQTSDSDWSALFFQPLRLQAAYGSNYFSKGTVTIYEIRFQRRKGSSPFTNVNVTVRIAMSTTGRNPDALNNTFSSNVGLDEVVVFNGTIALTSTGNITTAPLASPFDIIIPLTTPFTFDPTKGNFLIDFKNSAGFLPTGILGGGISGDSAARMFSLSSEAVSGLGDSAAEAILLVTAPPGNSDITFLPNGGGFTNSVQVSIYTRLSSGLLRYTTDGSIPTSASTLFTNSFILTESSAVKARYFINGFPASDVFSADFTKANPILFAPATSLFTNSLQVTLTNTLGTGIIRYTLDGSTPVVTSLLYSGPIQITDAKTITARLFLNNFPISDVYASNYTRVYALNNDGIPASWRQQYFGAGYLTDPRVSADADPDNDGSTNLQEFIAGTNPLDPSSGFRISFRAIPLLSWTSIVNSNYNILRRISLNSGAFTTVATIKATNTTTTFIDLEAGEASSQFFYTIQLAP